tara:strand:+ start:1076 stop:1381 length:306 start_codon:yes stop_codon:yes gene_type:complete
MNKHIKLVEKWLDDKDSVTQEELEQNKEDAAAAVYGDAADDAADAYAYYAANYAANAAADADHAAYYAANAGAYYADAADTAAYYAEYWVGAYKKLTGEEK